jgi:hypothetical protein
MVGLGENLTLTSAGAGGIVCLITYYTPRHDMTYIGAHPITRQRPMAYIIYGLPLSGCRNPSISTLKRLRALRGTLTG